MFKRGVSFLALAIAASVVLVGCTDPTVTKPNQFSFSSVSGAEPGQTNVTSNTITITGINAPSTASVTAGGELVVEGKGAGSRATVTNGTKLAVRVTASTDFGGTVKVTVDVGGTKADFTVTTRSASVTPGEFDFPPVTDAEPGAVVRSDPVVVSGHEAAVKATVSGEGEPVLVINGAVVGSTATVEPDDELQVEITANNAFSDTVTAAVDVGGVEGEFVVTTRPAVTPTVALTIMPSHPAEATPGEQLTLSWLIRGDYDALTLTTDPATTLQDLSGRTGVDVTVPGNVPTYRYVLTASDSRHALSGSGATDTIEVPLWVCQDPDELITIADEELRAKFYAIPTTPNSGDITCQDARDVYHWALEDTAEEGGSVSSLIGMQHFVNLTTFNAQFNDIDDLTPIAGLTSLTSLDVQFNQVSDLAPIANLVNLERLNLDKNLVHELGPLANHPRLRILELWDNGPTRGAISDGIVDIGALGTIPTLEELYLSENYISDLTPLAGLTNLRIIFAIGNDIWGDLSALAGLENLEVLRINNNFITDASALAGLDKLGWLELEYNELRDDSIAPLVAFDNLWVVLLEGNFFTHMTPLIDNPSFPADQEVQGLPDYRLQPDHPVVSIGYNCLVDVAATETALQAKSPALDVQVGRMRPLESCDAVPGGGADEVGDRRQRQQEVLRMYQEEGRSR